ncbi:FG-GAP repeat domain-containing protein [Planctomicrobium piriforme]|uniref:Repeat domain-containing protein n=1 Tax=Planctomicrobium piriforme TaxID=1576369 RepID=A0A1I3AW89_9PLAN|nr:VCBS repeat-containing protein [Planctomicrobium piriforme]SFH54337.1 Repeat domain-containing protein [Planctomicrobium piriforme]
MVRNELASTVRALFAFSLLTAVVTAAEPAKPLLPGAERLKYQSPGLVVDLGVGLWAWPLPMDWDQDGDLDLVVSCPDVPYAGTYFFENPGQQGAMPVFKPGVKVGPPIPNGMPSYVNGHVRFLSPAKEYVDFRQNGFSKPVEIYPKGNIHPNKVRANQWRYTDYDGDGAVDLIVGVGDWTEYGWDNAFDKSGNWTRGPLHGYVYFLKNSGTNDSPKYDDPVQVHAAGKPVDTYGEPTPNFADFDGDGDLDLLCGEFLDGFNYFENTGSRTQPVYAAARRLQHAGQELKLDLEMIVPVAIDWDQDGDVDLIVGDEDGRVAFVEHSGKVLSGVPQFLPPRYFQQQADDVKFGALVSPCSVDWDGDGDEDLVCGNSAGYVGFIENLDGGNPPRWAAPKLLKGGDETIRIQAGPNGSIQGPCEAKWGYTTLSAADWNGDDLPDLVVNGIWGKVLWYENVGTRTQPKLKPAQSVSITWPEGTTATKPAWFWWEPAANEFVTQWRTMPAVIDWNRDGMVDLVMLDHEGYLTFFGRQQTPNGLTLKPGQRLFQDTKGNPLRLNAKNAGGSGRRKFCLTDWDGDGKIDLLLDSKSVNFWKNVSKDDATCVFEDQGPVTELRLAGHDTSPTPVHWSGPGLPDLVIGAEDGRFYLVRNPNRKQ